MTEQEGSSRIEEIQAWFRDKGFGMTIDVDEASVTWANLTTLSSGKMFAPKYGRGDSSLTAVESAMTRYQSEQ